MTFQKLKEKHNIIKEYLLVAQRKTHHKRYECTKCNGYGVIPDEILHEGFFVTTYNICHDCLGRGVR